jgi:hypothetical protein
MPAFCALSVLALAAPAAAQIAGPHGSGATASETACGQQAGPCLQEERAMDREANDKGLRIRIVTHPGSGGGWQAQAEFADQAGPPVKTEQDAYASEHDAYTAALSAAMAQVDRARAGIGKP